MAGSDQTTTEIGQQDIKRGVWHVRGPLAQIERMAEWADRSTPGTPLDDETAHKIARNIRAAVAVIREGDHAA